MSKQQGYLHFSEVLTDDVLDRIAAAAREKGDVVMALRCEHAKVDEFARRDVAICLDERQAAPLTAEEIEGLSEGIRDLVLALRHAGFWTTDSGDGSNWESGMDCALPFRHVFVLVPVWQDPQAEAERLRRRLAYIGVDDEYEVLVAEPPDVLMVQDKRANEICEKVGYEGIEWVCSDEPLLGRLWAVTSPWCMEPGDQ